MRLEKIRIQNYRIYKDVEIDFINKGNKDISIIIGKNTIGKTTLLNAINWCLYNDEPHLHSNSISLPLFNLEDYENIDEKEILVELYVKSEDGSEITFKRTQKYANGELNPESNLEVFIKNITGQTIIKKDQDADFHVDNFVPKSIREFFFFDGEQLDSYFINETTRNNIENRIFILSHIDILENMKNRLNTKYKEFNKEANKIKPDTEEKYENIEKIEKNIDKEEKKLKSLKDSISTGKTRISKLDKLLKGIPDVRELEEKLSKLKENKSKLNTKIIDKRIKLNQDLLSSAPSIFLEDAINYSSNRIKEKEDDLPPPVEVSVINESLEENKCKVCGRSLDNDSCNYLNNSLNDYELSDKQSKILRNLKIPLMNHEKITRNYQKNRKPLIQDLKDYEKLKKENEDEIKEIEVKYAGYDNEKIKKRFEERQHLEESNDTNNRSIGSSETKIKNLNKDLENAKNELDSSMEADEKTKYLNRKKELCTEAIDVLTLTNEDIMNITKENIEKITKKRFFDFLWRKDTYSDVYIDESYNLELIHSITKQNSLGSASAAERELLVLSFTLGIHAVSGFNSPLLIDTPLARVSDIHRENFAKVLLEISKSKQIILILTPAEFSDEIKELFNEENISKYKIEQGSSESYSEIMGDY